MGEVELNKIGTFVQEFKMIIKKLVACQDKDFQFLRGDYFPIQD
jgi:hypothetical protein